MIAINLSVHSLLSLSRAETCRDRALHENRGFKFVQRETCSKALEQLRRAIAVQKLVRDYTRYLCRHFS
jgi:hypothetical protein